MSTPSRRPRVGRRALATASRAPSAAAARSRVAAALGECTEVECHVIALWLDERLSVEETALALGLPVRRVTRIRSTLLDELRRAVRGRPFRRAANPVAAVGLRKAS